MNSEFTSAVEGNRRRMLVLVRGIVGDGALAEDIVQDAVLAYLQAASGGKNVSCPGAWLMKVARNRALDAVRSAGYSRTSGLEAAWRQDSGENIELHLGMRERAAAGVAAADGRMSRRRRVLRTVVSVTAAAAVLAGAGVLVFDGGRFQGGASGLRLTVGGRSVADEALAVEIVDRELARLGDVQAALDLSMDVLREAARVRDSTMSVLEDRMVLDFKIK